eukprot:CAMPEP_0206512174 /NCGR_PEP_ID=MMETSP0324_2-20121206/60715_1 /ASSEMBLY_ACC=CAM_ASM_000836 /TAXON_ID=2866 /ORGANISM="Crypthecodinium cohnii, Strain Seligo" /LENGTH=63 /DNA_ID=CAMNT_0054004067 /DNA_START=322 /DNA_END=513 /DNA_ORIENTATION=-
MDPQEVDQLGVGVAQLAHAAEVLLGLSAEVVATMFGGENAVSACILRNTHRRIPRNQESILRD